MINPITASLGENADSPMVRVRAFTPKHYMIHDITALTAERNRLQSDNASMLLRFGNLLSEITFAAFGHRGALTDEQLVESLKGTRLDIERLEKENGELMAAASKLLPLIDVENIVEDDCEVQCCCCLATAHYKSELKHDSGCLTNAVAIMEAAISSTKS